MRHNIPILWPYMHLAQPPAYLHILAKPTQTRFVCAKPATHDWRTDPNLSNQAHANGAKTTPGQDMTHCLMQATLPNALGGRAVTTH